MNTLLQDLRYALRMLFRSPGFTLAAVLTLALGIGANTAIFTGLRALVLKPLPLPDAGRIVMIWGVNKHAGFDHSNISYDDCRDWRAQARSFERLAAFLETGVTLTGRGEPEVLPGARVSADFFPALGVKPALGRELSPEDDRPGAARVVVLSDGIWRRLFGADPKVLEQTIALDGRPHTVIGIMPRGFELPSYEFMQAWTAIEPDLGTPERGNRSYKAIGRLKPGATFDAAQTEIAGISRRLADAYPKTNTGVEARLVALKDEIFDDRFRLSMQTLMAAVLLVLLIGCANISNLLLARTRARRREIAVRTALGAGRARIVRQLLTESLLLALAGAAAGLLVAAWGTQILVTLLPPDTPRLSEIRADGFVFAFAFALSVAATVVFGLFPALDAARLTPAQALREDSARATAGGRRQRFQAILVAAEVALAFILLVAAGLLGRSLQSLHRVDPGFRPENVVTMEIDLGNEEYPDDARVVQFYEQALERIAVLPGVRAAAAVNTLPLGGSDSWILVAIEGRPPAALGQEPRAGLLVVSADYFRALEIPLVAGRVFGRSDTAASPPVSIVNQTFARRFWPGQNAVGQRLRRGRAGSGRPWVEVIAVARDVRHRGLREPVRPEMFFPLSQDPTRSMTLAIRTAFDPLGAVAAIRRQIHGVGPNQAVTRVRTMEQIVEGDASSEALLTGLLVAFAVTAVSLAVLGLAAVVSLSVAQSRREIGVRMALGAGVPHILGLILRRWMSVTAFGMAAGLAGAVAIARLLSSLLFGVKPTDIPTLVGVTALLASVAFLASYVPANHAAGVSPMEALKNE